MISRIEDRRRGAAKAQAATIIDRAPLRLIRPPGRIETGEVVLDGVNLLALTDEEMRRVRLGMMAADETERRPSRRERTRESMRCHSTSRSGAS